MATEPQFSLTGISNNAALSPPVRPGSPGWPMGQALHLSAQGNAEAPKARGWGTALPRGPRPGGSWRGVLSKAPMQ